MARFGAAAKIIHKNPSLMSPALECVFEDQDHYQLFL